jgi:hypothetical protein
MKRGCAPLFAHTAGVLLISVLMTSCNSSGGGGNETGSTSQIIYPADYRWANVAVGAELYFHDDYETAGNSVFEAFPAALTDDLHVETRAADATDPDFYLEFTLNRPSTVFVAYDISLGDKPAWLNDWQDTQLDVDIADKEDRSNRGSLRLFKKDFGASTVQLGKNVDKSKRNAMYTVIVPAGVVSLFDLVAGGYRGNGGGSGAGGDGSQPGEDRLASYRGRVALDYTGNLNSESDSWTTVEGSTAVFDVLTNDYGLNESTRLIIATPARHGAVVVFGGRIYYEPVKGYVGSDYFTYYFENTLSDGTKLMSNVAVANIDVAGCEVFCAGQTTRLILSWSAVIGVDKRGGYEIYLSRKQDDEYALVYDLEERKFPAYRQRLRRQYGIQFDSGIRGVMLEVGKDLNVSPGDQVCFRLRAYSSAGRSNLSEAVCA